MFLLAYFMLNFTFIRRYIDSEAVKYCVLCVEHQRFKLLFDTVTMIKKRGVITPNIVFLLNLGGSRCIM